jgi:hypothetical protein
MGQEKVLCIETTAFAQDKQEEDICKGSLLFEELLTRSGNW